MPSQAQARRKCFSMNKSESDSTNTNTGVNITERTGGLIAYLPKHIIYNDLLFVVFVGLCVKRP